MRPSAAVLFPLALLFGTVSCDRERIAPAPETSPAERQLIGNSPQETIQAFYSHLNAGEYSKAKELYSTEARRAVDGELFAAFGGFVSWAEDETHQGSIERVRIIDSRTRGEGGHVDFEIAYKDGTVARRNATVVKEGISWKMGLINDPEFS